MSLRLKFRNDGEWFEVIGVYEHESSGNFLVTKFPTAEENVIELPMRVARSVSLERVIQAKNYKCLEDELRKLYPGMTELMEM